MSSDISSSRSGTYLSLGVAGIVALLTVGFHVLLAERPYGIAFALFVVLLVVAMHVIALLSGRQGNVWAYAFLAPVLLATVANVLFASEVVRVLAFPLTFGSLVFFSYWFTAPRILFRDVATLWPQSLFFEAVLPLEDTKGFFEGFAGMSQGRRILTGFGIAIPFLLVIGALFISADPLFKKYVAKFFFLDHAGVGEAIAKIIRDIIVAVFLLRTGWAMLTRALHARHPKSGSWTPHLDSVVLTTFLGAINVLFLAFIVFQFVYFFGGEKLIQEQGLTYAEYARSGFFELLAVSGIVFFLSWIVYRVTSMRHHVSRILSVILIAQTTIIIFSAIKRLNLYVDAYGMTVSRWWAYAVMMVIGLVLLSIALAALARTSYTMVAKTVFVGILIAFSGLLLLNTEGFVAKWNVKRLLAGEMRQIDLPYLFSLSSDAVPALVDLANGSWSNVSYPQLTDGWCLDAKIQQPRDCLRETLRRQKQELETETFQDWRNPVWSDYRALAAIGSLK